MKQFNLQEYLANPNCQVVTRDGRKVRIICTNYDSLQPIIAEIEDHDFSRSFTKNGRYYNENRISPYDLFFASEKHEGWVNILNCPNGNFISHTRIFKSKEDAEKVGKNFGSYLTTIKIEWEE